MTAHNLKIHTGPFRAIHYDIKRFEVRENDRDFQAGDKLILREHMSDTDRYTGNVITAQVTYVTRGGNYGLPENLCVLSIVKTGEFEGQEPPSVNGEGEKP